MNQHRAAFRLASARYSPDGLPWHGSCPAKRNGLAGQVFARSIAAGTVRQSMGEQTTFFSKCSRPSLPGQAGRAALNPTSRIRKVGKG